MSERLIVAIVGTGLIGGSVGMAARHRLGAHVRGTGRRAGQGVELGALDEACTDIGAALRDADIAVVCAPVDVLPDVTRDVLAAAPAGCAVTDVGSTKREVVAAAGADERFVGGHPLAGAEVAGVEHAREDLFDGATWYLTPQPTTSGVLLERVHRLLDRHRRAAGDRRRRRPRPHDGRRLAPAARAGQRARRPGGAARSEASGCPRPGRASATRPASPAPTPRLWTGIYRANRDALLRELDGTIEHLRGVRAALPRRRRGRAGGLAAQAGERRRALLEAGLAGGPVRELRAAVPNRPGVIADIALTLGARGHQHLRHGAQPLTGQQQRRRRALGAEAHARPGGGPDPGLGIPVS